MNLESRHSHFLTQLLRTEEVRADTLERAPLEHGAYVLWLDQAEPLCLKIGIANPGRRRGLRGRLRDHFSSHPRSSVLARHMTADRPQWAAGFDFAARTDRCRFIATRCYVRALAMPQLSREELREFERYIQLQLTPRYCGAVGNNMTGQPGRLRLDEHDQALAAD